MNDLTTHVNARYLFGRHGFVALDWYGRELTKGIDLRGADALEIGAGDGLLSLWLLHAGARSVTSLEPEADGSTNGVAARAAAHRAALGLAEDRWRYLPDTFQSFAPERRFDVILSHNSINHLDEAACVALLSDACARWRYRELFGKIRELLHPGGHFVFADCARENYWARVGRPSPWARRIEWHKHQEPDTWCGVLLDAGLTPESVRWWHPWFRVRRLAPLLDNRIAARCLSSYFVVSARRA